LQPGELSILCQTLFKRIDVRFLDPSEIQSESGGYVHTNGRIIFPIQSAGKNKTLEQDKKHQLRTKWVEMKITLQVSAENDLVFTNEAIVRIREKLA